MSSKELSLHFIAATADMPSSRPLAGWAYPAQRYVSSMTPCGADALNDREGWRGRPGDATVGETVGRGAMANDLVERLQADPKYRELLAKRTRLGWSLTAVMLAAYFGYIALIAFDKAFLARPIQGGVTSLGIPLGFGLIVFTVLITGVYVWIANARFDALTRAIVEEAGE